MTTPIDKLMEDVAWKEVSRDENILGADDDRLPWVTHEGVFSCAGITLRCYRLNTGQAIFNAEDMDRFLCDGLGMGANVEVSGAPGFSGDSARL